MSNFADYVNQRNLGMHSYNNTLNVAEYNYAMKLKDENSKRAQQFLIDRDTYEAALEMSRQAYMGTDDNADDFYNRRFIGKALSMSIPGLDEDYAAENVEDLMYMATGYRANVDKWTEHLANTFRSSGNSVMASFRMAGLYTSKPFRSEESFQESKEKTMKAVRNYATEYNKNRYLDDKGLFMDIVTEATSIVPSMLPSMGVTLGLSILGGIGAIPVAAMGALDLGGRFIASAMQEMGSSALELAQIGADDDVILGISSCVGLINGILESAFGAAEKAAVKPLQAVFNRLGNKKSKEVTSKALKDVIKGIGKDIAKDIIKQEAEEVPTEILQELTSMYGYNVAIEIQKLMGKPLEDAIGYSMSDFVKATVDVAASTAKGTLGLGLTSGALRFAAEVGGGDISKVYNANKVTNTEGSNGIADKKNTTTYGPSSAKKPTGPVAPINVFRIGDKYVAVDNTPEQNYVARNSKQFNVNIQEMNIDESESTIQAEDIEMSLDTLNMEAELALKKGLLKGIVYYDSDKKKLETSDGAEYVGIQSNKEGLDSVIIKISKIGADDLDLKEIDDIIFGESLHEFNAEESKVGDEKKKEAKKAKEEKKSEESEESEDTDDLSDVDLTGEEPDIKDDDRGEAISIRDIDKELEELGLTDDIIKGYEVQDVEEEYKPDSTPEEQKVEAKEDTTPDKQPITATEGKIEEPETPSTDNGATTQQEKVDTLAKAKAEQVEKGREAKKKSNSWASIQAGITTKDQFSSMNKTRDYFKDILTESKAFKNKTQVDTVAKLSAIAVAGFARAQGKTIEEFMSGLTVSTGSFDSDAKNGQITGNVDSGVFNITLDPEKITPVTLAHEISHYFLATLQDGKAKNLIKKAYRNEHITSTKVQESFAKDFEKYLYTGVTSNSSIKPIFNTLKRVLKGVWDVIAESTRALGKEKVKMFDSIFYDEAIGNHVNPFANVKEIEAQTADSPTQNADMARMLNSKIEESEKDYKQLDLFGDLLQEEPVETKEQTPQEATKVKVPIKKKKKYKPKVVEKAAEIVADKIEDDAKKISEAIQEEVKEPEAPKYAPGIVHKPANDIEEKEIMEQFSQEDYWDYDFTSNGKNVNKYDLGETTVQIVPHTHNEIAGFVSELHEVKYLFGANFVGKNLTEITDPDVYNAIIKMSGVEGIDNNNLLLLMDNNGNIYMRSKLELKEADEIFAREKIGYNWFFIPGNNNNKEVSELFTHKDSHTLAYVEENNFNENFNNHFTKDAETNKFSLNHLEKGEIPYSPATIADCVLYYLSYIALDSSTAEQLKQAKAASGYANLILSDVDVDKLIALKSDYKKAHNRRLTEIIGEANTLMAANPDLKEAEAYEQASQKLYGKSYEVSSWDNIGDYIKDNNSDIMNRLANLDPEVQEKVLNVISNRIDNVQGSYNVVAKTIAESMNDEAKMVQMFKQISAIYKMVRNKLNSPNLIETKYLGKYFKGKDAKIYNKFLGTVKGFDSMTADEIKTFFNAIVDKDGRLKNVEDSKTHKGNKTSFLIDLLNMYNSNKDRISNPEDAVNQEYYDTAQYILKKTDGVSDNVDVSVSTASLLNLVTTAIGEGDIPGLYDIFTSNNSINMIVDKVMSKVKTLAEKEKKSQSKIKNLTKQLNAKNKIIEDEVRKNHNLTDKAEKITDIRKKYEAEIKSLEAEAGIDKLKQEIATLKGQVTKLKNDMAAMLNNKDFKAANEISEEYNKLFNKINKMLLSKSTDARAGSILMNIVKNTENRKNIPDSKKSRDAEGNIIENTRLENKFNALNPDLFKSQWEGYDGMIESLLKKMAEIGMIAADEDGVLYLANGWRDLDIEELSSFVDELNQFAKIATKRMNAEKAKEEAELLEMRHIVEDSLWNNRITEDEANTILDKYLKTRRSGSQTDLQGIKSTDLSQVLVISNLAKRISPDLYAYLFGGSLNGKLVKRNLNSMTDQETKFKNERVNRLLDGFSELFGIERKEMASKLERVFSRQLNELSNTTIKDFEEKNFMFGEIDEDGNLVFGENVGEKWESLARVILEQDKKAKENDEEAEILKADIEDLKSDLEDMPDGTDEELEKEIRDKQAKLDSLMTTEKLAILRKGTPSKAEYTRQQMMGIYIFAQNYNSIKDMMSTLTFSPTNNIPLESILWVIDQFENNEEFALYRKAADLIQEVVGERYDEIAEVYYKTTNKILTKEENYYMLRHLFEIEDFGLNTAMGEANRELSEGVTKTGNVSSNVVVDRKNTRRALDLNIVDTFAGIISEQEHYIAFKEGMAEYEKLLKPNTEFSNRYISMNAKEDKDGKMNTSEPENNLRNIRKWLSLISNSSSSNADIGTSFISKMRNNFMTSVLFANLNSILQAFPTYLLISKEVGLTKTAFYGAKFIKESVGNLSARVLKTGEVSTPLTDFVYEMSPQMKDRRRYEIYTMHKLRKNSISAHEQKVNAILNETFKTDKDYTIGMKEQYRKFIDAGLHLQEVADSAVANASWYALYNTYLGKLDKGQMTDEEFSQYCANMATQKVLNINSSFQVKDNALIYSSKDSTIREWLMFSSQLNKQFNILYDSTKDFADGEKNVKNFMSMAEDYMVVGIVTALAAGISGKTLKSDDDDSVGDVIMSILSGILSESLGMLPIVGTNLRDLIDGVKYVDTGLTGSFINLVNVLKKPSEDRTEHQLSRALVNIFTESGQFLGYPSSSIQKIYNTIIHGNLFYLMNATWGRRFSEDD